MLGSKLVLSKEKQISQQFSINLCMFLLFYSCQQYLCSSYARFYLSSIVQTNIFHLVIQQIFDIAIILFAFISWCQKIGEKVSIDSSRAEKLNMMTIILHVMVLPWTAG